MNEELRVGSTVYVFDEGVRHYTQPEPGRTWGELIWRDHWVATEIIGENRVSWILKYYGKLPKKWEPDRWLANNNGQRYRVVATLAEVYAEVWMHENRGRLMRAVEVCRDVATLRKVDALLSPPGGLKENA